MLATTAVKTTSRLFQRKFSKIFSITIRLLITGAYYSQLGARLKHQCADSSRQPETELRDSPRIDQPNARARLPAGVIDPPNRFNPRQRTPQAQARLPQPPYGLGGPRIERIPHQLYIANEAAPQRTSKREEVPGSRPTFYRMENRTVRQLAVHIHKLLPEQFIASDDRGPISFVCCSPARLMRRWKVSARFKPGQAV